MEPAFSCGIYPKPINTILMQNISTKVSLGVIVGNRDFFPDRLISEARADIIALFGKLNITP
jgi:L-fucose isomerase-like protein